MLRRAAGNTRTRQSSGGIGDAVARRRWYLAPILSRTNGGELPPPSLPPGATAARVARPSSTAAAMMTTTTTPARMESFRITLPGSFGREALLRPFLKSCRACALRRRSAKRLRRPDRAAGGGGGGPPSEKRSRKDDGAGTAADVDGAAPCPSCRSVASMAKYISREGLLRFEGRGDGSATSEDVAAGSPNQRIVSIRLTTGGANASKMVRVNGMSMKERIFLSPTGKEQSETHSHLYSVAVEDGDVVSLDCRRATTGSVDDGDARSDRRSEDDSSVSFESSVIRFRVTMDLQKISIDDGDRNDLSKVSRETSYNHDEHDGGIDDDENDDGDNDDDSPPLTSPQRFFTATEDSASLSSHARFPAAAASPKRVCGRAGGGDVASPHLPSPAKKGTLTAKGAGGSGDNDEDDSTTENLAVVSAKPNAVGAGDRGEERRRGIGTPTAHGVILSSLSRDCLEKFRDEAPSPSFRRTVLSLAVALTSPSDWRDTVFHGSSTKNWTPRFIRGTRMLVLAKEEAHPAQTSQR